MNRVLYHPCTGQSILYFESVVTLHDIQCVLASSHSDIKHSDLIIRVRLSRLRYPCGHVGEQYHTLRFVASRGRAMTAMPGDHGAMAAVMGLGPAQVAEVEKLLREWPSESRTR